MWEIGSFSHKLKYNLASFWNQWSCQRESRFKHGSFVNYLYSFVRKYRGNIVYKLLSIFCIYFIIYICLLLVGINQKPLLLKIQLVWGESTNLSPIVHTAVKEQQQQAVSESFCKLCYYPTVCVCVYVCVLEWSLGQQGEGGFLSAPSGPSPLTSCASTLNPLHWDLQVACVIQKRRRPRLSSDKKILLLPYRRSTITVWFRWCLPTRLTSHSLGPLSPPFFLCMSCDLFKGEAANHTAVIH